MKANTETYKCAQCGGTFEKVWTDEEAVAEALDKFGTTAVCGSIVVVCEDCYRVLIK